MATGKSVDYDLEYGLYCMRFLFSPLEDQIDMGFMTKEEFINDFKRRNEHD
jgi:hypothetical protein